ncbi:MAG: response regulator transcription factor [Bacteroidetes bacterium]|nr:response regulator transcription factor [Bacteroidota bacterium]
MQHRFLIADDHAVARRGLKEILLEAFPFAEIKAVGTAEEVMAAVIEKHWDMVITDISMPGRSGLELLSDLNKEFPGLPVLILSAHAEEEYAIRVIKAGGAGFLNKDDAVEEELVKAVNVILKGRKYITQTLAEKLAMELSNETNKAPHELLSDREFQVFKLLAQGTTTGDIAKKLSLSVNTVGTFRSRILAKMNMKTNAELVAYAITHHLMASGI